MNNENENRESGTPGGGEGMIDEVGKSGIYPVSASEGANPEARVQPPMSFGQGNRGADGYEDAGLSEISNFADQTEGGTSDNSDTKTTEND